MSDASPRSYVGSFRAHAAVRFSEDGGSSFFLNDARGRLDVSVRTYYEHLPDDKGAIPRTLWFEVWGPADSLDDALHRFQDHAGTVGVALTMATNAAIEETTIDVVFDATDGETDHEFFQEVHVDEEGLPRTTRQVDIDLFLKVMGAFNESVYRERLYRSAAQYQRAIRHLLPGQEVLVVAHLWMAVEALTKAAREQEIAKFGSRDVLLSAWGIELKNLDAEVRRRIIFQGDTTTYAEARQASNGFEHGFLNMHEIAKVSTTRAVRGLAYMREAILRAAGLDDDVVASLSSERFSHPLPSVRLAKYIRATLLGPAQGLAHTEEDYPRFRVATKVESIVHREDGKLDIKPTETLSWRFGDGTGARHVRYESWGPATATSQDTLEWSARIVGETLDPGAAQEG